MKKIALLVFAIFCITFTFNTSKASFPVAQQQSVSSSEKSKATTQEIVITENEELSAATPAAAGGGKSQMVAMILCGVVGYLGIHRFYLGYIWQGVVQLLTFGVCGIWTLIDFIRILTGSLVPKDGSYGTTL